MSFWIVVYAFPATAAADVIMCERPRLTDFDIQRFVIVTLPRSGSYHLVSLLDSAEDVRCYGEIFKKRYIELPDAHLAMLGLSGSDMDMRDANGPLFLDATFEVENLPIQGFKAFPEHLDAAQLKDPKAKPGWKYIFLKRNGVSSFVSGKRAESTGLYVLPDGQSAPKDDRYLPIPIDIDRLKDWLEWQDRLVTRWQGYVDDLGPERIHIIDYHELSDPARLRDVLGFLGSKADGTTLESRMTKQFDRPFWDGVANADEVKTFLEGSPWAGLLAEVG